MKTIVKNAEFFNKILGEQKINKTIKYRPIKFLVFEKVDEGILAYNTFTKQLLLINEIEYDVLKNISMYNSIMIELIKKWFLVPEQFDEIKCFNQVKFFYNKLNTEKYINNFTILPTTDCNARCFYCCEHGQQRINMSDEIAVDVAKFIVESSKGKKVRIKWFGGEPLYNINPINIISEYLNDAGIEYKANMITNAYLFDSKYVKLAKNKWHLSSVQITLDGTEKIYNKTKSYIYTDNDNPFQRVIDNIKNLSNQKIHVIIRLNMDLFNRDDLYNLVDYLANEFFDNSYVTVYTKLLFDDTSNIQINRTNVERREVFKEFMRFEDYIIRKKLYHYLLLKDVLSYGHCSSESDHAITILPKGDFGLCELRTDTDICGNIYDGITDNVLVQAFKVKQESIALCSTCPIYPNCSRLKKCPYYLRKCEDYEQELLIRHLKQYMIYTYKMQLKI